jgi:hypothetical protein
MDVSADMPVLRIAIGTTGPRPRTAPAASPLLRRRQVRPTRSTSPVSTPVLPLVPFLWENRIRLPPRPGHIRLLDPPPTDNFALEQWWYSDRTYTEWHRDIAKLERDISAHEVVRLLYPTDLVDRVRTTFLSNQRQRWLAHVVLARLRNRIWRRRTVCNVDLIDLKPVADRDAIFLTDTPNRQIYKFHRRDVYSSLISSLCMCDEMWPCPRPPKNPYTNQELTLAQTIGICQQLNADYTRRGTCVPVLFAAFWAARFDLDRFQKENASVLAQNAITTYFKDIHDDNLDTVFDTLVTLLREAALDFSAIAIRRWLRSTPITPLHREWLTLLRDYTLYMNLHVQIRPHWHSTAEIYEDVSRLYERTRLPDPTSQRIRILRGGAAMAGGLEVPLPPLLAAAGGAGRPPRPLMELLGIPMPPPPPAPGDLSGNMPLPLALELIRNALFHL